MFKFGRTSRFEAERTVQKIASNAQQFFGFSARTALKESGDATAEANTMFATRVANRVSLKGLSLWTGFFYAMALYSSEYFSKRFLMYKEICSAVLVSPSEKFRLRSSSILLIL